MLLLDPVEDLETLKRETSAMTILRRVLGICSDKIDSFGSDMPIGDT